MKIKSVLALTLALGVFTAFSEQYTWDGNGETITLNNDTADFEGWKPSVELVNGTWDRGSAVFDFKNAKTGLSSLTIGDGATFTAGYMWLSAQLDDNNKDGGMRVTVGKGGQLLLTKAKTYSNVNDGRREYNYLTIDGGTFNCVSRLGVAVPQQKGSGSTAGVLKVLNGGHFNVDDYLGFGCGWKYSNNAWANLSYSTDNRAPNVTVEVEDSTFTAGRIYVGNTKEGGTFNITFRNSDIALGDFYAYEINTVNMTLDGARIGTLKGGDANFFMTRNDTSRTTCTLGAGGVTFCCTNDYGKGDLRFNLPASGEGFFCKKGPYTMTFRDNNDKAGVAQTYTGATICEEGILRVPVKLASKSIEARGGVIDLTGGSLTSPKEEVAIVVADGGSIIGLDLRQPYRFVALGGGITVDMVFGAEGCETPFTAANIDLSGATSENPIVLNCSFTEGVHGLKSDKTYTIIPASELVQLKAGDETKFFVSGISAELKVVDGALVATPGARPNGRVVWNGGEAGGNWGDNEMWWYQEEGEEPTLVNFLDGDTAVFAKDGDQIVVDGEMKPLSVIAEADVVVSPLGEIETAPQLAAPTVEVAEGATAEIYAPFAAPFEKTGKGTLVLGPTNEHAVVISDGRLTFNLPDPEIQNMLPRDGESAIGGILDLAGAEMTLSGSLAGNGVGVLRDGGSVTNGTLKIEPLAGTAGWWRMQNTEFTVRKDATLIIKKTTDQGGEMGFNGGAKLVIDGGRVEALNKRSTGGTGGYLGCDNEATNTVRIVNGGYFYQPNQFLRVGFNGRATGILSVDDGTVDIGGYELRMAAEDSCGILALTNAVLKAHALRVSESAKDGKRVEITMKDTTAYLGCLYSSSVTAEGSYALFDNATLVPEESNSEEPPRFFGDLRLPVTVAEGGLIISNTYDVGVLQSLAGPGALVKRGPAALTISTAHTLAGGVKVVEGTVKFAKGASFAKTAEGELPPLTVADDATIDIELAENGFAGTSDLRLVVDAETTNQVNIVFSLSKLPTAGTDYALFGGGITAELLEKKLNIPEGYTLKIWDDGHVTMRLTPTTQYWYGRGETNLWSVADNWSKNKTPILGDKAYFSDVGGGETVYDLPMSRLEEVKISEGVWTTDVQRTTINAEKLSVLKGAGLVIANAANDPLPTGLDAVEVGGFLDLGGATQNVTSYLGFENSNDQVIQDGFLRDGVKLVNGKLKITPKSWCKFFRHTITIGTNANVVILKNSEDGRFGQLNLRGTTMTIDNGTLEMQNDRSGDGKSTGYLGNGKQGDSVINVINGGKFIHKNEGIVIGFGNDGECKGALKANQGTLDFKGRLVYLGGTNNSRSELELIDSSMTCDAIIFGLKEDAKIGQQILVVSNSTMTVGQIKKNKFAANSYARFNGATLIDANNYIALLYDLGAPYSVDAGGLTIKIADKTKDLEELTVPGKFSGTGDITLVAAGTNPKAIRFSGDADKGNNTGTIVVSSNVTFRASGKTFGGSLRAEAGSALTFGAANNLSTFDGEVTIDSGVKFEAIEPEKVYVERLELVKSKTSIAGSIVGTVDPVTHNTFSVKYRNGEYILCYQKSQGTTIIVK